MLENVSIKKLLYVIPAVIILSFVFLYFSVSSNIDKLEDKSVKASLSNKIIKQMLDARISEKNYIRRKDPKYAQELEATVQNTLAITKELQDMFQDPANDKLVENVKTNIQQYSALFKKYQKIREESLKMQQQMVKEANDVEEIAMKVRAIQKRQRDNIIRTSRDVKAIADEIEEASLANKIVKELMVMRINEKNYISRKDEKYLKAVEDSIKKIKQLSLHVKDILDSPKNKKMMDAVLKALEEYHKAFKHFSTLREESMAVSEQMKKEAREAEDALVVLRKDQKNEKLKVMNAKNAPNGPPIAFSSGHP